MSYLQLVAILLALLVHSCSGGLRPLRKLCFDNVLVQRYDLLVLSPLLSKFLVHLGSLLSVVSFRIVKLQYLILLILHFALHHHILSNGGDNRGGLHD